MMMGAVCFLLVALTAADLQLSGVSGLARREGDRLIIDVPAEQDGKTVGAAIPVAGFNGKGFRARIRCRGTDVSRPAKDWNGLKFMFRWVDADGKVHYPNTPSRLGTWDWTEISCHDSFAAADVRDFRLIMGLQESSGRLEFDLSSLVIEPYELFPRVNRDFRVKYPRRTIRDVRRRGVMLPAKPCTVDDFETLFAWGVNLVRYQMTWFESFAKTRGKTERDLSCYRAWLKEKLDHLESFVLPEARKRGIKVVVDLHSVPGGKTPAGEPAVFEEDVFIEEFLSTWRTIATRFKGNEDVIYGYDLINEPAQVGEVKCDYWNLQRRAAEAVRAIDPETAIIVESNGQDCSGTYAYLSPLKMHNVIYQLHIYQPTSFTHQGVWAGMPPSAYPQPDKVDIDWLRREMKPVIEFSRRHHAKIYVGEFSAIAWAEGAERYLADVITICEENGWDWTYHAFREWQGWSVEHEGPDRDHMRKVDMTPRKEVLLRGFNGEFSKGSVRCWPVPKEVSKDSDYTIAVSGKPLQAAKTKPPHPQYVKDYERESAGRMRMLPYAFAQFEAEGEVSVRVAWKGGETNFSARVPFFRTFEPFGRDNALILAGNLVDRHPPFPKTPGVKYCGPGYRRQESIVLSSGETLYLAPGAWVEGCVRAVGDRISIRGHGVLAGTPWSGWQYRDPGATNVFPSVPDRKTGQEKGQDRLVHLQGNGNRIEGVTLFDSFGWTCAVFDSTNVTVRGVKIMGGRTGCDDGVDLSRVSGAIVSDSFIRTGDDLVAMKWWCHDIQVTNCTFWSDAANVIRIGYENDPPPARFSRIEIRDCDVLHLEPRQRPPTAYWASGLLQVEGCREQWVEDVLMENVRLHCPPTGREADFIFKTHPVKWGFDFPEPGHVRGIAVRNVAYMFGKGRFRAFVGEWDADHLVEDVTFEGVDVETISVRGGDKFNFQ